MAKVIKVTPTKIVVGMDDGSLEDFEPSLFDFVPTVGQQIDVFKNDDQLLITKRASKAGREVNKTVYAVLALFLGWVGVNRFYAGQTTLGVIYLSIFIVYMISVFLTLGIMWFVPIPLFIALVEFVIALTKPADENGNITV